MLVCVTEQRIEQTYCCRRDTLLRDSTLRREKWARVKRMFSSSYDPAVHSWVVFVTLRTHLHSVSFLVHLHRAESKHPVLHITSCLIKS